MKKINLLVCILFCTGILRSVGQYKILLNFNGSTGENPYYTKLILSGKTLYGMTENGGGHDSGNIFRIDTNGTRYKDLFDFSNANGFWPYGSLLLNGGKLYGMASSGGSGDNGNIFSIDTNGNGFKELYGFPLSGLNGANPLGSLTLSGYTLYGMADAGGLNSTGVIFSIDTDGTGFYVMHNFGVGGPPNGINPHGSLTLAGKLLYGMAEGGGASGNGTIFSIDTGGNTYTDVHDFNGTDGEFPEGDLTLSGSLFYGMTEIGGANNEGCIFSIDTNGTKYKDLLDFNNNTNPVGANPYGDLNLSGGRLYGMTNDGGGNYTSGCIFSMDTNGSGYSEYHKFNDTNHDGTYPSGSLTISGNRMYGMTYTGGSSNYGIIFADTITPPILTGINAPLKSFSFQVYPNPAKENFQIQLQNQAKANLISLYTVTGQEIMKIKIPEKQNIETCTDNLSGGVYLIKVGLNDGSSLTGRVVIVK